MKCRVRSRVRPSSGQGRSALSGPEQKPGDDGGKKIMKLTRLNGRAGVHGTYNVKHNDRDFDVKNSDYIDEDRAKGNVYWDCFQGSALPGQGDARQITFAEESRVGVVLSSILG